MGQYAPLGGVGKFSPGQVWVEHLGFLCPARPGAGGLFVMGDP